MRTSSRQSLTWSAHNAVEECRNSNVRGDAAETGLQNGNGQIRPPEAPNRDEATLAGRCAELLYLGGFVLNATAKGHHPENLPGKNSTDVMEPADRSMSGQRHERVLARRTTQCFRSLESVAANLVGVCEAG
jgi:hypothetical protein